MDQEILRVLVGIDNLLTTMTKTLIDHKEAIDQLKDRLDAIDRVLYSHKESIESLQNYISNKYKIITSKEYIQ